MDNNLKKWNASVLFYYGGKLETRIEEWEGSSGSLFPKVWMKTLRGRQCFIRLGKREILSPSCLVQVEEWKNRRKRVYNMVKVRKGRFGRREHRKAEARNDRGMCTHFVYQRHEPHYQTIIEWPAWARVITDSLRFCNSRFGYQCVFL